MLKALRLPLQISRAHNGFAFASISAAAATRQTQAVYLVHRTYASKSKNQKSSQKSAKEKEKDDLPKHAKATVTSTASLVPGSKQPITDPAAQEEYAKAEKNMQAVIEWFRKECATTESRASGRITPALLAPVRVHLSSSGDSTTSYRLEEVATVGVRDGSTFVISVFEEDTLKSVEQALYDSKLPNIVPQRQDSRTIKIPIPKPTVEARQTLFVAAQRKAEDIRVQIRKQHQTSIKRGKYAKHSVELDEFQKLTNKYIGEVDKTLANLKQSIGSK